MTTSLLLSIIRDQRGTSAVEMGLICAFIVIAMFSALQGFANANTGTWTSVADKVRTANNQSSG